MTNNTSATLLVVLLSFVLPLLAPLAVAQGEDGSVTMTSPTSGQTVTYYTSGTTLSITCTTTHTPQSDGTYGAGIVFAVRPYNTGGFDFNQGYAGTSPYTATRTMAQWGITGSGSYEARCRVYNAGTYYWATRTFNVVIATSGEDGSVSMTSPTNGQSFSFSSGASLSITCTTTHAPQSDGTYGAGVVFAVRQAGVGGYDFSQGYAGSSPYTATRTMAQWGITGSGSYEARCRVYNSGLYYWSTKNFNITQGEDGSVTMTSPTNGQTITNSPLSISCTTTHAPQSDGTYGAGMVFAVRPAGTGAFDFSQGYASASPYTATRTFAQWGITGAGSYEARCRVYDSGNYFWSTRTFSVTQGEDGTVTMTSPTSGQVISPSATLSITCTTTHTPQSDGTYGAGVVFAVRPANTGAFDFSQGYAGSSPYTATRTLAQWGITGSGSYEARCRVYDGGLYFWSTRTFSITQGEDGSITMTSPTEGQSISGSSTIPITCTTTHTPQSDGTYGAGIVFAVRPAGTGGFDFSQGYAGASPYTASRTPAQWGITGPGSYEARCRVYEGGLYFWSTRTFTMTQGEDGTVTMTSPANGQSVSGATLSITCTTTHTPQSDGTYGAGVVFAVRPAGVGGFDFNQGYAGSSPYTATRTMAQWGITGSGSYEARCRVYEGGFYYWSTRTFTFVNTAPVIDVFSCGLSMSTANQAVDCTLNGHDVDSSGLSYTVDWGDGSAYLQVPATGTVANNAAQTASHTYGVGTYTIRLQAMDAGGGASAWRTLSQTVGGCGGPSNNCAPSAVSLTDDSTYAEGSVAGATLDSGEPQACNAGTATVWFRYNAPATPHRVVFDTMGSSYDTVATVYTGATMQSLSQVACDDEWGGTHQSRVEWIPAAGATYYIQVAGHGAGTGTLQVGLRASRLLALGDSVAAGYGTGPSVSGYPDSPDAYVYRIGTAKSFAYTADVAISGACAAKVANGDSRTDPNCNKNILGDELTVLPWTPTDVVITVGANDIDFSDCLVAYIKNSGNDPCQTRLTDNTAALQANLRTVLQQVKAVGPVRPNIVVTKYYNPFPPALAAGEDVNHVCDLWFPAAMARDHSVTDPLAAQDHNGPYFRSRAALQQRDAAQYVTNVITTLNNAIQAAADAEGVPTVQLDFQGHEVCATIRGLPGPSWVYAPTWQDSFYASGDPEGPSDYTARWMGDACSAANNHDPAIPPYTSSFPGIYSYEMDFWSQCMPHPTPAGQQAIADAVALRLVG
ncbi:MAG: hypothetical protein QOE90_3064 [Thermoplasmata archaeon]|jgi:lysophospholipase L1-like esterase|nr:hypothetical protein [Thermoplasmata archaeon]